MNKDAGPLTTRDFGVTLTNPRIHSDINEWIYELYRRQGPLKAEQFKDYRNKFDRAARLEEELDFPLHLIIEAYYGCNYRCPQCLLGIPSMKQKYGGQGYMSMTDYKKIINEAEQYGTRSVLLNGVNEPLLDADLFERIHYAREHGFLDIHLHSNGELMTEQMSHRLIDSQCTRIMVSLDAFSAETFSKIRMGGHYDTVMKNIDRFLEIRLKKGADFPVFRVSMVRQKGNEHEIQPFIDYWTPRVDYVHLQTYMEMLDTRGFNHYVESVPGSHFEFRCEQPWYAMYIRPKGDVHPCCSFLGYELPMGNRRNTSLYEIWNGEPFKTLRALHKRGEYKKNAACEKCVKGWFPKTDVNLKP